MDTRQRAPRRSPLLPTALLFLGLSFIITVLDAGSGFPAAVWVQSAAFWVGMICVAGHVLRLALALAAEPSASDAPYPGSWGETETWGPPSQR